MNNFINYVAATVVVASFSCKGHAEELPSAESLFAKHVEASYGKGGLQKYTAMTKKQELNVIPFRRSGSYIVKNKSPGFFSSEGQLDGQHRQSGCNQTLCWENGERGLELIKGKELDRWLEQYDYHRWENIENYAQKMQTLEKTIWEDNSVYKVRLVDNAGQENFYYFAIDTGFLVGANQVIADLGSTTNSKTIYEDFTQFGPFTLPAKITRVQPSFTVETTIQSVSFEAIPDSAFAIPGNVQQLLSQQQ